MYTQGLCPQIQKSVIAAFGANAPAMKRRRLGLLEGLMSSYNRSGFEVIQIDGGQQGKIRIVQLVYDNPYCLDVATGTYDCTQPFGQGQEPDPKEKLVTLPANPFIMKSGGNPKRLKLDQTAIRYLCESEDSFAARQVLNWLINFEEGFDLALGTLIAPLIGTFANGDSEKNLPLYANDGGGINNALKSAQHKLRNEYTDIRATGLPIIIGDNLFQNYNSDVNRGACCNLNGVSMVPSDGWYYFEDDQIESSIGDKRILALAPGAVQLVTWNKYAPVETDEYNLQTGRLVSPWTGMQYDMKMVWDSNCEAWFLELMTWSQLQTAPSGGCGIDGANGTLKFITCAQEETFVCDANES